jgi:hypothetical protein
MAMMRLDIDSSVNELLKDAANRYALAVGVKVSKQDMVMKILNDAAAAEYARQQAESASTKG